MQLTRRATFLFLILTAIALMLSACSESYEFTHCELTLILEEGFEEKESDNYDLLVSNGEAVVSLNRISLDTSFESGISDTYTAKGFAAFFMNKSGKSDELLMRGDVPYYTYTEKVGEREIFYTVTFYRSYNAYFTVAYATGAEMKEDYSEKFLIFAERAYFNDAPEIKAE